MNSERLVSLVDAIPKLRIGILGDFFLDKYLDIDPSLDKPSLETGRPAHQVVGVRTSPGAAGNVANNLAALGVGSLYAIACIGDDGEGYDLLSRLGEIGCSTEALFRDSGRMTPTYMKPRDIGIPGLEGEHDRYDIRNWSPLPVHVERNIMEAVEGLLPGLDALVIADQVIEDACGVVTGGIRDMLAGAALRHPDIVFLADSRARILLYRNIVIKPNQFEITGIDNPAPDASVPENELAETVSRLRPMINAPIFATRGADGIMISDPEPITVRGIPVDEPNDPTGAGDAAAAGIVTALAAGAEYNEAAIIGNLAASVTVGKLGECGTCTPAELVSRFEEWSDGEGR